MEENYLSIVLKISAYLDKLAIQADEEEQTFYEKVSFAFQSGMDNLHETKYEMKSKEINDDDYQHYVLEPIALHIDSVFNDRDDKKKAAEVLKKAHPIMKKYLR